MANANKNKQVVQELQTVVEQVQPGTDNGSESTATPGAKEVDKQEHTTAPKQTGGGEQTDDKGNSGVDTQNQGKSNGEQGNEAGSENEETIVETSVAVETKPESPSVTEQRNKIAKEVFFKHPMLNVIYFTSDLLPFGEKSDAIRKANTLADKTIIQIQKQ